MEIKKFQGLGKEKIMANCDDRLEKILFGTDVEETVKLLGVASAILLLFLLLSIPKISAAAMDEFYRNPLSPVGILFFLALAPLLAALLFAGIKKFFPFFLMAPAKEIEVQFDGRKLVSATIGGKKFSEGKFNLMRGVIVKKAGKRSVVGFFSGDRWTSMPVPFLSGMAVLDEKQTSEFLSTMNKFDNLKITIRHGGIVLFESKNNLITWLRSKSPRKE